MKLLVVGNGATGVNDKSEAFINSNTGNFLFRLSERFGVTFLQFSSPLIKDGNLQNFELRSEPVACLNIKAGSSKVTVLTSLLRAVFSADAVYLFWPGSLSRLSALLCVLLNKRYGLYIRGQFYDSGFLSKFLLKRAEFIATVSPSIKNSIQVFNSNVATIRPMIEQSFIEEINSGCNPGFLRLNSHPIKLLFVGRVEERKGIYDLINIISILADRGLAVKLDIVGGGDSFETIKELVKSKNLSDRIEFHGLISDSASLKAFYAAADAFVFTSHDEGFPRVLYEAMSVELPIFTTFVGGISGRMIDGVNSVRIYERNPELSADIIEEHLENTKRLIEIGKQGRSTLIDVFAPVNLEHHELLGNWLNYD